MAPANTEKRKSRTTSPMHRERKVGTRVIKGPDDCPASRIQGCNPCVMEAFGVLCEARKKAE